MKIKIMKIIVMYINVLIMIVRMLKMMIVRMLKMIVKVIVLKNSVYWCLDEASE